MKISKNDFVSWKNDNVTKQFFEALQEMRGHIEDQMLDSATIVSPNGQFILTRLVGIREGLDQVLTLTIEDFDDDDVEEPNSSGT